MARAILADPDGGFAVRALTRRPESEAAKALREAGAEVVQADADDRASLEEAFKGCAGLFVLTNYWETRDPFKEYRQLENVAAAAAKCEVGHVVYSTLEDSRRLVPVGSDPKLPPFSFPGTDERLNVPHMDKKGEADRLFAGLPCTYLLTSTYYDNSIGRGHGPQLDKETGGLVLRFPIGDAKLPGVAVEDIGRAAYAILRGGPAEFAGKHVGVSGGHMTGEEMAAEWSAALGREVKFKPMTTEQFRALPFPGADDLASMWYFQSTWNREFCEARSVEVSRAMNPQLHTLKTWLKENVHRVPIPE